MFRFPLFIWFFSCLCVKACCVRRIFPARLGRTVSRWWRPRRVRTRRLPTAFSKNGRSCTPGTFVRCRKYSVTHTLWTNQRLDRQRKLHGTRTRGLSPNTVCVNQHERAHTHTDAQCLRRQHFFIPTRKERTKEYHPTDDSSATQLQTMWGGGTATTKTVVQTNA